MTSLWGHVTGDFHTSQQTTGALSGKRVLIVEDEVIVAFNMECEIEDAGGIVVGPAYSVAEASLLVDSVDAAVLDININGEQIWTIAEALAARAIPFVFASANCQDPNAIPARFAEDTPDDEVAEKPAKRPGGKTSITNKPKPKGRR